MVAGSKPRRLKNRVELPHALTACGLNVALDDAQVGEREHFAAGVRPRPQDVARFVAILRPVAHMAPVQTPQRTAPRPRARRPVSSRGPPADDSDPPGDGSPLAARQRRAGLRVCTACGAELSPVRPSHSQPSLFEAARAARPRKAGGVISDLPPHARQAVQRVLDRAAARLLAEQMDGYAVDSATGGDHGTVDGGADDVAPLAEREPVPVRRSVDGNGGAGADA